MSPERKHVALPFHPQEGIRTDASDRHPPAPATPKRPERRSVSISPAAVELVAERFRILGEPLRIRLIQELRDGEKSVTELVEALGATQPNVSKHLRIIQSAGIAGRRHDGNLVYYFITDSSVLEVCEAVCATITDPAS